MVPTALRRAVFLTVITAAAACAGTPASPAPAGSPSSPPPGTAPGAAPASPEGAAAADGRGPWIRTAGTTTLGFGILRLAPGPGKEGARFRIRFRDYGDGGYSSDATNAVLIVLPGDAFAEGPAAYADSWLAFARGRADDRDSRPGVATAAEVSVDRDRTVLVAYGPWDGADVGRPPSDRHTFDLDVDCLDGGNYRWVESEAGEMVTTNWTARPGVKRGGAAVDPLTGERVWIETRILVLYDPKWTRPSDAPAATDADRERMPLEPDLHATLRRVPIRWR